MLTLDDVLRTLEIDPTRTLVVRHVAEDRALQRHFGWIMRDRGDLRDAYQRLQFGRAEAALRNAGWLVSCVGEAPGQALVVGIAKVLGAMEVELAEELALPPYRELQALGTTWPTTAGRHLRFNFEAVASFDYASRLLVDWPGREVSWFRWASNHRFDIRAILPESEAAAPMPEWRQLRLSWAELRHLPEAWQRRLAEWRGIYLIWDRVTRKSYVGSAGGRDNLLGRWQNYAQSVDGGNVGLIGVVGDNLVFSILERTSPDMNTAELVALENGWKLRLSSLHPDGNNRN